MPGHVVKSTGPDPDPTEYLYVSLEQKRIDQTKPYDAKKATWIADEKEGFVLGEIKGTKGDLVIVGLPSGEVSPPPSCFLLFFLSWLPQMLLLVLLLWRRVVFVNDEAGSSIGGRPRYCVSQRRTSWSKKISARKSIRRNSSASKTWPI